MRSWFVWCWFAFHGAAAAVMAFVYATRFGTRCDNGDAAGSTAQSSATWAESVAPALVACAAAQCLMLAACAAVRLRGSTRVAVAESLGLCLMCGVVVATVLPCMILFAEVAVQPVFCSCGIVWAACDLARSVLCVASACHRCGLDRPPTAVFPGDLADGRVGGGGSGGGRSSHRDADDDRIEATVTERDEDDAVDAGVDVERPPSRLSRSTADSAEKIDGADATH